VPGVDSSDSEAPPTIRTVTLPVYGLLGGVDNKYLILLTLEAQEPKSIATAISTTYRQKLLDCTFSFSITPGRWSFSTDEIIRFNTTYDSHVYALYVNIFIPAKLPHGTFVSGKDSIASGAPPTTTIIAFPVYGLFGGVDSKYLIPFALQAQKPVYFKLSLLKDAFRFTHDVHNTSFILV
ncbi:hypothetical protein ALC57_16694, partial [Trachymyrmex cornetzi]